MKTSTTHLPSLLSSLLFLLAAVFYLGVAFIMGIVAISKLLTGGEVQASETILSVILGFEGLLVLAAAYFSFQKFLQKPSADLNVSFTISARHIATCLIVAGAALVFGRQLIFSPPANWLLLPLLTIPVVILPILVLLGLGVRGISTGPRWQTWSVFGISMTLVPFVAFFLEAMMIVVIFFFGILFIASQPELVREMERLASQIYMLETDPEAMMELIAPLMLRPGVMIVALLLFSVLVPMVEELVKPLGVWLYSNKISSPAQGFALGALSGAAYALIETLGVSPQYNDWATLLPTRIGTGILHVTTSALVGAGIVYAVKERRYLRLLGLYLLAVTMHGLWNGLALLFSFSTVSELLDRPGVLDGLTTPLAIVMVLLAILYLILLVAANRKLREALPAPIPLPEEAAP